MANKIDQIKVGSTTYDIVPNAVDNGDYKASCPALTSDTTLEVQSNKTTTINSSSTDSQYPSAKAVYDVLPKLSGTASAADVRKGKTFYKDSAVAQTGTMPDSSLSVSSTALTVSPTVTPTAVASATGNISLTAASTQPSSGYYIAATGGNSKTTGSSTAGSSSTISTTAGYIAASSKNITSSATATANANSKTAYYTIPPVSFNNGFSYKDNQSEYSTYLTVSAGYSDIQKMTGFELAKGEKLYNYTCSGVTYTIDIAESGAIYRLSNTGTIEHFNNYANGGQSNYIGYLNNYSNIKTFTNRSEGSTGYIDTFYNGTSTTDIGKIDVFYNYGPINTLDNEGGTIATLNNGVSSAGTIGTIDNGSSSTKNCVIQTLNNYSGNIITKVVNYGIISTIDTIGGTIDTLTASASGYHINTFSGNTSIGVMSASSYIDNHTGTMTVKNSGTINVTNSKTTNIQANTGTVKYISWTIKQDSSGNITFSK